MTDVVNPKSASPDQLLPYHKKISAEGKALMICFISYTYMVLKEPVAAGTVFLYFFGNRAVYDICASGDRNSLYAENLSWKYLEQDSGPSGLFRYGEGFIRSIHSKGDGKYHSGVLQLSDYGSLNLLCLNFKFSDAAFSDEIRKKGCHRRRAVLQSVRVPSESRYSGENTPQRRIRNVSGTEDYRVGQPPEPCHLRNA